MAQGLFQPVPILVRPRALRKRPQIQRPALGIQPQPAGGLGAGFPISGIADEFFFQLSPVYVVIKIFVSWWFPPESGGRVRDTVHALPHSTRSAFQGLGVGAAGKDGSRRAPCATVFQRQDRPALPA